MSLLQSWVVIPYQSVSTQSLDCINKKSKMMQVLCLLKDENMNRLFISKYKQKMCASIHIFVLFDKASSFSLICLVTWNTLYPVAESHVIMIFYYYMLHKDLRMQKETVPCRQNINYAFLNIHVCRGTNGEFIFFISFKHFLIGAFYFQ